MLFMAEDILDDVTIPMALEHTCIAMAIVFSVLIVISCLIYLLKFVPELLSAKEKREAAKKAGQNEAPETSKQPDPVRQAAPAARTAQPKSAKDQAQIIAVIAAAIAAQMTEETGVPVAPEGLVIRSIKKRNI